MTKEHVITAVDGLGDEFNLDALLERLLFIEQIVAGRADVQAGRTLSNEEMKAEIQSWTAGNNNQRHDAHAA